MDNIDKTTIIVIILISSWFAGIAFSMTIYIREYTALETLLICIASFLMALVVMRNFNLLFWD
jgi:hypothetical protein